ncbi:aminoglycoside 6-adenylyltransferase [Mobilitalea sibirica]|uniref:Aminoglycoside 6-adenylyltransferase n=1 Tax=Mobilitalea sibirica TaxID=1462919 RepID=A0A8J7L261_9FIRM|nr:aminoglycoside 6-adenylyltransferase [Mobilitalea sibirica]MBH1940013.1 aminoglycoside 6-adenylyltransferase [Mobilitalea sibirica]
MPNQEKNSYTSILESLVSYADKSDLIQSMILFGSRARVNNTADKYSDYDIILLVKDIDYFLNSDEWLNQIEKYYISFQEPTAAGGQERRVFFKEAMDMDFLFYHANESERLAADPTIKAFLSRGYKVLVDKIDFEDDIERNKPFEETGNIFSEKEFLNLVNTFWFHSIWSVKKILRGELWSAKSCIDCYMKNLLRQMVEEYSKAMHGKEYDIWHDGRFFDQWVDEKIRIQLKTAYGSYDTIDMLRALNHTIHIFSEVSQKTSAILNYTYPITAESYAMEQITTLSSPTITNINRN